MMSLCHSHHLAIIGAVLLATTISCGGPTLVEAREIRKTEVDSWQSIVPIADFAFIPPDENDDSEDEVSCF